MTPIEATTQLVGIMKLIPEGQPPTPEQWEIMRQLIQDSYAYIVGRKFMEENEEKERQRQFELEWMNNTYSNRSTIYGYTSPITAAQGGATFGNTTTVGIGAVDTPDPQGLISKFFGKK